MKNDRRCYRVILCTISLTMSRTHKNIPYLTDLVSFYDHVRARPPLHKDFDIREINPEVLKGYDYVAKPFRHSFYCIDLLLDADVTLNSGFWKRKLSKPALYFKTPCQVLSWMKPERWIKEYFIVFTEDFMLRYKALADIIFDLPFFQIDQFTQPHPRGIEKADQQPGIERFPVFCSSPEALQHQFGFCFIHKNGQSLADFRSDNISCR